MTMERAATLTPPYLPPLGGPQHQNVASQEEDVSPSSWPGKEGFTTLMAPTRLPWGPDALICTNPSGILVLGPCPVHELCCDGAAAGQSCCWTELSCSMGLLGRFGGQWRGQRVSASSSGLVS